MNLGSTSTGLRFFLAVAGDIVLQRDLAVASTARVTGDLTFVEVTAANSASELIVGGTVVKIEDIDMMWDTDVQPTD